MIEKDLGWCIERSAHSLTDLMVRYRWDAKDFDYVVAQSFPEEASAEQIAHARQKARIMIEAKRKELAE